MAATLRTPRSPWQWLSISRVGALLLVIGVLAGVLGFRGQHGQWFDFQDALSDFYANISMELVSIAFTVLILDQMYRRRETFREKQQVIRLLGGRDPGMAQEALGRLRQEGWVTDGSLNRANLEGAQLAGADLARASLMGADLRDAVLFMADLSEARLDDADLRGAQLAHADLGRATGLSSHQLASARELWGATMADGRRYDGRFDLPGDLEEAERRGYQVADRTAMARFYDVPLLEFEAQH